MPQDCKKHGTVLTVEALQKWTSFNLFMPTCLPAPVCPQLPQGPLQKVPEQLVHLIHSSRSAVLVSADSGPGGVGRAVRAQAAHRPCNHVKPGLFDKPPCLLHQGWWPVTYGMRTVVQFYFLPC